MTIWILNVSLISLTLYFVFSKTLVLNAAISMSLNKMLCDSIKRNCSKHLILERHKHKNMSIYIDVTELSVKNPAYGRHWLSRPMLIIGPDFFLFFLLFFFLFFPQKIYIGPMISIGREIQCLPYAVFFLICFHKKIIWPKT